MSKAELIERTKAFLLMNCERDKVTGCWNWCKCRTKGGYGTTGTQNRYVHRLSFELWRGKIPDGLLVCHHCDNKKCFNPNHLFVGTHKDNIIDAVRKGRWYRKLPLKRGTENGRAVLNESSVKKIRASTATCRSLAKLYGVSSATIHLIKRRQIWTWLK